MAWWHDSPDRMRPGLVAAAIALDALALIAALDGAHGLAATAHIASATGLALGLGRRAMRTPRALVFAMTAFLPLLGTLGWLAVAAIRPAPNDRPVPAYLRTPVPGPEAARVHAARPLPRRGDAASARVLAARGRDDPGATALLRRALADRDEDVRLVAHAVLESKQRVAYRRVQDGAGAHDSPRDARDLRLAAAHWELARADLADGECLAHALASARRCARAAAARQPRRASLALLVGRIELRRGAIDRGEAALARAVELGLPPAVAAPYLAEAAFLRRRFDRVAQRLAVADAHPALARLRRFWS
jgi:hypothetical protein